MTFQKDLLTVIVPTRERPDTLKHCLRTLVEQRNRRFQILVSDNVSGPETKQVVDSFSADKRIKYVRPESRLGMSEHFDFALSHADGEWVTFLGDDDGFLPNAVNDFFELAKNKDIKAINTSQCRFYWPNESQHQLSKLTIQTGRGIEVRPTKPWLQRVLHAKEKFIMLPYIYTGGFVHADVIHEIRQKSNGRFFLSITPDAYSGIAVALTLDKYLYSWSPLTIAGLSKHSNGVAQMNWKKEDIKKISFFSESSLGFHPALGNGVIHSMPMLIYEAFMRAAHLRKDDMGIAMEDQIALAIIHAKRSYRSEDFSYCKTVAEQNNLDFSKIEKKLPLLKLKTRATRILKNIVRSIYLNGEANRSSIRDETIRTIYDASVKCGRVLNKAS